MRALPMRPSTLLIALFAVLLLFSLPGAVQGIAGMAAFAWSIPHPVLYGLALVALITWRGKQHATRSRW